MKPPRSKLRGTGPRENKDVELLPNANNSTSFFVALECPECYDCDSKTKRKDFRIIYGQRGLVGSYGKDDQKRYDSCKRH